MTKNLDTYPERSYSKRSSNILQPLLTLLFLLSTVLPSAAQIDNSKNWDKLLTSLDKEDWGTANSLSLSLLKNMNNVLPKDTAAAVLRYIYIYSEAGLMNTRKESKEQGLKKVKEFVGKFIILPAHPVTAGMGFNSIQASDSGPDTLFITASNKAATNILCFEYVTLNEKWSKEDVKNRSGQNWMLCGTLKTIDVEGLMFPRFKLQITHAFAKRVGAD